MTSPRRNILKQTWKPENTQRRIQKLLNVFKRRHPKCWFPKTVREPPQSASTNWNQLLQPSSGFATKPPEWSDLHGYVNKSRLILHEYLLGAWHPESTAISLISQTCSSDCKWLTSCIKYQRNRVALHFQRGLNGPLRSLPQFMAHVDTWTWWRLLHHTLQLLMGDRGARSDRFFCQSPCNSEIKLVFGGFCLFLPTH